jgi:hypothetical protein
MRLSTARRSVVLFAALAAGCPSGSKPAVTTPPRITITPATATVAAGTRQPFRAVATYADGTTEDVTSAALWSSSAEAVAILSTEAGLVGTFDARATGTATITSTLGKSSASATLTVDAAVPASLAITPAAPVVASGASVALHANETLSDGTTQDVTSGTTWSIADTRIATIDSSGSVTGGEAGMTTITATTGGLTVTTELTVTTATLTSVTIVPVSPGVPVGLTLQLAATGTFSDGKTEDITSAATWTTSDSTKVELVSQQAHPPPGELGGLVSGVATGSATISASLAGVTGSAQLNVSAAVIVSITISPGIAVLGLGDSLQLHAEALWSDGTMTDVTSTVLWTVASPGLSIASVDAGGFARSLSAGTTTVSATLSGITGAAGLAVVDENQLASITITPLSPAVPTGDSIQLGATGTFRDGSVLDLTSSAIWASSDASIAIPVSQEPHPPASAAGGLIAGVAAGTAVISASLFGVTASVDVSVLPAAVVSVAIAPVATVVARDATTTLVATATLSDGSTRDVSTTATWNVAPSDSAIASVNSSGDVRGLSAGTAQITATFGGTTANAQITVIDAPTLVSLAITPTGPSVAKGGDLQLKATGTFLDGTMEDLTSAVAWSVLDLSIADLVTSEPNPPAEAGGQVRGISVGTTTVTASLGTVTTSTGLTVTPAVITSIAINPSAPTLAMGTSLPLQLTATYSDGTTQDVSAAASWSIAPGDEAFASVTSAGVVHGSAPGTAQVTADLGDVSGVVEVVVTDATLTAIAVAPGTASVAAGDTQQFVATGTFTDGTHQDITSTAVWGSSDSAGAVIVADEPVPPAGETAGQVLGAIPGMFTVTATQTGISGSADLTVTPAVVQSIAITPAHPVIAAGTQATLAATATFSDGSSAAVTGTSSWSVAAGDTAIATVPSAGVVRGTAPGSATITVTKGGVSTSVVVVVTSAVLSAVSISPALPTAPVGETVSLTATGTFSDNSTQDITSTVDWTSATPAVAQLVSAEPNPPSGEDAGTVAAVAPGTSVITASQAGVTGSVTFTVGAAALTSITITPPQPAVASGQTVSLHATAWFSDGSQTDITGSATWSVASGGTSIASVQSSGVVHGDSQGTATVDATLGGVTGSVTVTVMAPVLTQIQVTPANPSVPAGGTVQLLATGTWSDGSTEDITSSAAWSSGTPAAAQLVTALPNPPAGENAGLVKGLAAGTSTVAASLLGVTGFTLVAVTPAVPVSLSVTPPSTLLPVGTTQFFHAVATWSDGNSSDVSNDSHVQWATGSTAVATVSFQPGSEAAAAAGPGSTSIMATYTSGALVLSAQATVSVEPAALVSIAINPVAPSAPAGTTLQLAATGTFTDQTTQDLTSLVQWSSSDLGTVTVSNNSGSNGVATAANTPAASSATIQATWSGVTASTTFDVSAAVLQSITLSPPNAVIAAGQAQAFTAQGTYSNGLSVDLTSQVLWSSTAPSIASLDATVAGQFDGQAHGTVAVSATLGAIQGTAILNVTQFALVSVSVTPNTPQVIGQTTVQLTASGTFSDGTTQDLTSIASWATGDGMIATFSGLPGEEGLIYGVGVGTTAFSATVQGITAGGSIQVTWPSGYPATFPTPPQVVNSGGPVLASPVIVPIFFTNDDGTTPAQVMTFLNKVAASSYWITSAKEYGIGVPTIHAQISGGVAPTTTSDTGIYTWLENGIANGTLPAPGTDNTLYTLFYPGSTTISDTDTSCVDYDGYHSDDQLSSGQYIAYAVIPRCPHQGSGLDNDLEMVTTTTSHELFEGVTDPYPDYDPAYTQADNAHLYWDYVMGGSEIADMCQYDWQANIEPPDVGYLVQRIWSNQRALAGHDPCGPEPVGEVYFNAVPVLPNTTSWHYQGQTVTALDVNIQLNHSKTVTLDLSSEGDIGGSMTVIAQDLSDWNGGTATMTCTVSPSTGTNGTQLNLTITPKTLGMSHQDFFVVTASDDNGNSHQWVGMVGGE